MCLFCKCPTTKDSFTTFTATFDNCIIIVKNVPCEECEQCGEKYISDTVMTRLEEIVNKAKSAAIEVCVTEYPKQVA